MEFCEDGSFSSGAFYKIFEVDEVLHRLFFEGIGHEETNDFHESAEFKYLLGNVFGLVLGYFHKFVSNNVKYALRFIGARKFVG